jgi:hypothetical protein
MVEDRLDSIEEELEEVESFPELKAIWCHWQAEWPDVANDPTCATLIKGAVRRIKLSTPAQPEVSQVEQLEELLKQVQELRANQPVAAPMAQPPVKRSSCKYELLKTDVTWSTIPQVHAIMHIISAHAKPGDVLEEADIIQMMEANVAVLQTRQGGEKIWKYYKGDHDRGLTAHGNLRKV